MVKTGRTLTIAHGMSRKQIDQCHADAAKKVSNGLMTETKLAELFTNYVTVEKIISNEEMYQVVGRLQ